MLHFPPELVKMEKAKNFVPASRAVAETNSVLRLALDRFGRLDHAGSEMPMARPATPPPRRPRSARHWSIMRLRATPR